MFEAQLRYGSTHVTLRAPRRLVAGAWSLDRDGDARARDAKRSALGANATNLRTARDELRASGFAAAVAGRCLGLLVADGTRSWDLNAFFDAFESELGTAGELHTFVCTGTHDPGTPENERLAVELRARLAGIPIPTPLVVHDARNDGHDLVTTTTRGTRVELLSALDACDAFLVVSDMKAHYFAGYSNAVKYFVPGLATIETARGNHSLAMDEQAVFGRHPWHPVEGRRANPLAEDMVEAFEAFRRGRPCFALTSVTSSTELLWAGAGEIQDAVARGIAAVDALTSITVEPARYLVVSAGGAPQDESLYTVQRALELSREAVLPGGEVLLLAQCPNGIGPPSARENFFEPLTAPLDEICASAREDYVLYSHKPVKFARLLSRLTALHVFTELDAREVRRIHMHPASDPQAVVDRWVEEAGAGDRIGFLDDASKLSVYVPTP